MRIIMYLFVLCSLFNSIVFCHSARYKSNKLLDVQGLDVQGDVTLLHFFRKPNDSSTIATLVDEHGNKFILKQKVYSSLFYVLEKLAADIAYKVGIPANQIELIPCDVPFIGKKNAHKPATLHTFAPGVLVNKLPKVLPDYAVSLQMVEKEKKGGKIIKSTYGITTDIIKNMSVHPDLPKIVALDTFIANHDRHRGNLFYDKVTDHFYVIDLEGSFKRDLAQFVYEYFSITVPHENIVFSEDEIKGLIIYRNMLKELIAKNNPKMLNKKFDNLIKKSLVVCSDICLLKIKMCHEIITANYNSCVKVINVLDVLLQQYLIS